MKMMLLMLGLLWLVAKVIEVVSSGGLPGVIALVKGDPRDPGSDLDPQGRSAHPDDLPFNEKKLGL
ncbi:MAG TPA: hypothetical protein VFJ58_22605 [Armatimonadota bacterium]|nr:hypothetical protein [Armatimonadota bacterium]